MRRVLRPRFTMDVAHTRNQGSIPRGARRGKLLGISWKGHGRRDREESGLLARVAPVVTVIAVSVPVLTVLTCLVLCALGKSHLIRRPPEQFLLVGIAVTLLLFLVWLVAFMTRAIRDAVRTSKRRRAHRTSAAQESTSSRKIISSP